MIEDVTFVGLVAACCSGPDDITPRGVLADWLDDNDSYTPDPEAARAWVALIRWSLNKHQGPTPTGLLSVIKLAGWHDVGKLTGRFSTNGITRGFPTHIDADWRYWDKVGSELTWTPSENRPCPPTAIPAPGVTIRSPVVDEYGVTLDRIPAATAYLRGRWPGVKAWHLLDVRRTVEDYQRGLINQLIRSTGIPPLLAGTAGANYAGTLTGLRTFNERLYGSPVLEPWAFLNPDAE